MSAFYVNREDYDHEDGVIDSGSLWASTESGTLVLVDEDRHVTAANDPYLFEEAGI